MIGRWQTSGRILDEAGCITGQISGTDTYSWRPDGQWIVHEVVALTQPEPGRFLLRGAGVRSWIDWLEMRFDAAVSPG